jgi:hypothetical protein
VGKGPPNATCPSRQQTAGTLPFAPPNALRQLAIIEDLGIGVGTRTRLYFFQCTRYRCSWQQPSSMSDINLIKGAFFISLVLVVLGVFLLWSTDLMIALVLNYLEHQDTRFLVLALLVMAIFVALLLLPILQHISYGWRFQFAEIAAGLTPEAKRTYLHLFHATPEILDPDKEFNEYYLNWYGRKRLLLPIIILLLIAIPVLLHLAISLIKFRENEGLGFDITGAAIAGAYTFVVADIITRVQRRSLRLVDIGRSALRLACAVPIGIAFTSLLVRSNGPFIAFALGAFPLEALISLTRRLASRQLNIDSPTDAPEQVRALSGIDYSVAERIADADITTIAQLAWCDPIALAMRTNLRFVFVVDIVSQALAWVYLEKKLDLIRSFGLRGAYEINVFLTDDLCSEVDDIREAAESVLVEAANTVGLSPKSFRYALELISEDQATNFLVEVG